VSEPYNPLAKINLGRSVAEALLDSPIRLLMNTADLMGAGVYAIYYVGDFPRYAPIAAANRGNKFAQPIYVGKAIPRGGRKGGIVTDTGKGRALRDRLNQHASSIDEVQNLSIADFSYRCLGVDDIWIPLGENMLIEQYKPIWNMLIDGFGNKTPGKGRKGQQRSSWDVIHPGRKFVGNLGLGPGKIGEEAINYRVDLFHTGVVPETPIDSVELDADLASEG